MSFITFIENNKKIIITALIMGTSMMTSDISLCMDPNDNQNPPEITRTKSLIYDEDTGKVLIPFDEYVSVYLEGHRISIYFDSIKKVVYLGTRVNDVPRYRSFDYDMDFVNKQMKHHAKELDKEFRFIKEHDKTDFSFGRGDKMREIGPQLRRSLIDMNNLEVRIQKEFASRDTWSLGVRGLQNLAQQVGPNGLPYGIATANLGITPQSAGARSILGSLGLRQNIQNFCVDDTSLQENDQNISHKEILDPMDIINTHVPPRPNSDNNDIKFPSTPITETLDNNEITFASTPITPIIETLDNNEIKFPSSPRTPIIETLNNNEIKFPSTPIIEPLDNNKMKFPNTPVIEPLDNNKMKFPSTPIIEPLNNNNTLYSQEGTKMKPLVGSAIKKVEAVKVNQEIIQNIVENIYQTRSLIENLQTNQSENIKSFNHVALEIPQVNLAQNQNPESVSLAQNRNPEYTNNINHSIPNMEANLPRDSIPNIEPNLPKTLEPNNTKHVKLSYHDRLFRDRQELNSLLSSARARHHTFLEDMEHKKNLQEIADTLEKLNTTKEFNACDIEDSLNQIKQETKVLVNYFDGLYHKFKNVFNVWGPKETIISAGVIFAAAMLLKTNAIPILYQLITQTGSLVKAIWGEKTTYTVFKETTSNLFKNTLKSTSFHIPESNPFVHGNFELPKPSPKFFTNILKFFKMG